MKNYNFSFQKITKHGEPSIEENIDNFTENNFRADFYEIIKKLKIEKKNI